LDDFLKKPVPGAIMNKRIGFTPIELLVVIAIIDLMKLQKAAWGSLGYDP